MVYSHIFSFLFILKTNGSFYTWVHNRSSLSKEFVLLVHVFAGAVSSFTLATSSSSTTTSLK